MEKMSSSPIEFIAGRLEEHVICNFCQHRGVEDAFAAKLLSLPEELKIRLCKNCDLRWLDPRPSQEAYDDLYREYYYEAIGELDDFNYQVALSERKGVFLDRLLRLKALVPSGCRILDVGAASGDFVAAARGLGFKAEGVEPSALARQDAYQKHDLELLPSLAAVESVPRYHVIHLNHVLEHLLDPLISLKSLRTLLADDGVIVFEVPYQFENIVEMRHRLLSRDNRRPFSVYSIHHPFFYSPRSLRRLFRICDFELVSLRTWNKRIIRGSSREKWLLCLGDLLFKKGDFIEAMVKRSCS